MTYKTLAVGMILFLSSACLPHPGPLSQKTSFTPPSTKEEASPSAQTGSENSSSWETPPSPEEPSPSLSGAPPPAGNPSASNIDFPISDEANDDFRFEVLPKDRPKPKQEFDIPIVINAKVEQFIQYFQARGRKPFSSWLARSERYIPIMRNLLKESGLPEDLVYLALIESGFNPYAYSRAKASGPWQFI